MDIEASRCNQCKVLLSEPITLPAAERTPCPECGSLTRHITWIAPVTIGVSAGLKVKARGRGFSRPFLEILAIPSFSRLLGKFVRHERTIDRENNSYREVVTDEATNTVIHQCIEPLSEHIGHGSAKKHIP